MEFQLSLKGISGLSATVRVLKASCREGDSPMLEVVYRMLALLSYHLA